MSEVRVSRYTVLPTGWDDDAFALSAQTIFTLSVEERSPGKFAVVQYGRCLRHDGRKWAYESQPSSRTDRFKRAYRMDEEAALALARKHVDRLEYMGRTWAEWKDEWR